MNVVDHDLDHMEEMEEEELMRVVGGAGIGGTGTGGIEIEGDINIDRELNQGLTSSFGS
jgi:hypothetical protein